MPESVKWAKGQQDNFKGWILAELDQYRNEAFDMEENWRRWVRRYENDKKRSFTAWEGSADIRVPTTQIGVDAVYARIMNTILASNDIYRVDAPPGSNEISDKLAKDVQKWLHYNLHKQNRFRKEFGKIMLGALKLGTQVVKTPYRKVTRRDRFFDDSKGKMTTSDIVVAEAPRIERVSIHDFSIRGRDIQESAWVSHRTFHRWGQLRQLAFEGEQFSKEGINKIRHAVLGEIPEEQTELESLFGYERLMEGTGPSGLYEIEEVWADFDVDNDGRDEPVVSWVERSTGTIIETVYNFYRPALRPFQAFRYIEREDSFWGKGIPEIIRYIQDEVDTIHDQRIDSATIANMKMFKAKKGSGVTPKTKIYPGKVFMLNSTDDLVNFDLGDKGVDSIPHERMAIEYLQLSLGLSDYNLGRESPGLASRATATSTIALIQQGQNRFDLIIDENRDELVELAYNLLDRVRQFGISEPFRKSLALIGEDPSFLDPFLSLDPLIPSKVALNIVVSTTSAKANKEIDKQNQVTLLGIYTQFTERLLGMFQLILSPEAPPEIKALAGESAKGMTLILEKIMEAFSIPDAKDILPDIDQLIGANDAGQRDLQAAISNSGVQNLPAAPSGTPGAGGPGPGQPGPPGQPPGTIQ